MRFQHWGSPWWLKENRATVKWKREKREKVPQKSEAPKPKSQTNPKLLTPRAEVRGLTSEAPANLKT
jgi:hypothetical protein